MREQDKTGATGAQIRAAARRLAALGFAVHWLRPPRPPRAPHGYGEACTCPRPCLWLDDERWRGQDEGKARPGHSPDAECTCPRPCAWDGAGKAPLAPRWSQAPWTPPEDVARGYRAGANLGIHCGLVKGAAVPVVAVDLDSAAALAWARSHLPPTTIGTVTSKGEHWYYRHPGPGVRIDTRAHVDGIALDIRADGGQVVCAPSLHPSGSGYTEAQPWTAEAVAALPVFSPAWFPRPTPARASAPARPARTEREQLRRRGAAYAAKYPPAVQGQGGSTTTFKLAAHLVHEMGLDVDEALDVMAEHWNAGCSPPWELEGTNGLRRKVQEAAAKAHSFSPGRLRDAERPGASRRARSAPAAPSEGPPPMDEVPIEVREADARARGRRARRQGADGEAAESGGGRGPSQATKLVALAVSKGIELFHTPDGKPYVSVPVGEHVETWPALGTEFKRLLALWYYHEHEAAVGAQGLAEAREVLAAKAQHEGKAVPVWVRVAEHDGACYLDLCDPEWRAVRVTADGWQIVQKCPVRFRRTSGMLPLPPPTRGGSVERLRELLNVEEGDFVLVLAWLVAALRPRGPYPILAISGEQGSAKSTKTRALRRLIDPNAADIRTEPTEARELVIMANNSAVVALDNMSNIPPWLSDSLCRLATGGGLSRRTLYADEEETIFNVQRPVILNGIEDLCNRADLLDRALLLAVPRIPEEKRITEEDFWADFDEACPGILGALLDAVAAALRRLPDVKPPRLPRMADFAKWIIAAEESLGQRDGAFLDAYSDNRADATDLALEASPVASVVREFTVKLGRMAPALQVELWRGTASELLAELNSLAGERQRNPAWPRDAARLSGKLKRMAPALRDVGVNVVLGEREGKRRTRTVTLLRAQRLDEHAAEGAAA